ncbi:isopeptide-forming domain-containing fimbrial protein [Paenibacillus lautus]|uniref:isopeptide-forming domain-containing fimbrial protein n=1 Tax=Paenibacillus lautus TaxID=1401 RepID=UPI002DBC1BEE|nr:isopeptide-forming domain-containing fimbrial protein [Paenibacillus lautus]MEC0201065.1 isopeptide-forming domain-containing fimbrial protein [Paenibacillus lautus]
MHSTRSAARKYIFKRFFIQFSVFLVILGGLQPGLIIPVQAAGGITINDTDSYATVRDSNNSLFIYQFDGQSPSGNPTGSITINGIFDGIGLDRKNGVFYGLKPSTGEIHKIMPDGTSTLAATNNGWSVVGAGGVSPDGTKFTFNVQRTASGVTEREIRNLDLNTLNISTLTSINTDIRDLVYDQEGSIYYIRSGDEAFVRLNPETLEEHVLGAFQLADGSNPITWGSGISILPDGKLLISDAYGSLYVGNMENNSLTPLGQVSGVGFIWDLTSGAYPTYAPQLNVEKWINNTEKSNEIIPGQEFSYTLRVANSGNVSASGAVLKDLLPEGTEYVPDSTTLNGEAVADLNGTSPLFANEGLIIKSPSKSAKDGSLLVGEDEAAVVTFRVKAKDDAAIGTKIANTATVSSNESGTITSDEVVSTVTSGTLPAGCPAPVALINGSFEEGAVRGSASGGSGIYYYESEVPGWKTTDNATGQPVIELWDWVRNNPSVVKNWPAPPDGGKWAELNAFENGMLYQDVKTTPGQTINWRLSHMGRQGVDTMQVRIGAATANPYDTKVQRQITDGNTAWGTYTGTYTVPAGQTVTRFGFEAVSTASGSIGAGNFIDDIFLGTAPCVTANKTASPQEVNAGDEVTYKIQIKNEGGDIAADTSVKDLIPKGTEYVPGSMKLIQGSTTKDLTDAADVDEGHFDGSQVSIQLGNLANTSQLADGVTVQFKVKVLASSANQQIKNKAQISYNNLLTGDTENKESNETTTLVRFNPPVLESNKSAVLQTKAAGNTDADHPEVGDTLRYTIQARNTALNSFVSSLVISDDIPAGLQYVPGSLKVDGVSVTDDESDQDGGMYTDGQVIGLFGDITDTEWHTLEFEAIISTGQAGKNIRNIAVAGGENVNTPSQSEEVVQVYPRHPVLESEKFATNLEAGKATFEVGDTVAYTIQTRTVTSDTYISNLKITDTLPEGLEYVPGTLKVDGASVTDTEGDDNGHYVTGSVYGGFGDIRDMEWHKLEFNAVIQTGQAGKDIRNIASVSGDNIQVPSTPEEEIKVYPRKPVIVSEKSATNLEAGKDTFEVGDTAIYSIRTRTVIGDTYMANLVISDTLPAGLEYIPGSLKVDGVSVTDNKDTDKGHYDSGQVVGHFGDVKDTKWHTLEFRVKIVASAGQSIRNTGEITGDNIDEPSRPTEEIVVVDGGTPPVDPPVDPPVTPPVNPPVDPDPPVTPPTPPSPVIESRKTSKDINGGSIAVGDTMEYTISARNTISGSYVSNLVIADILPEGLAYVAGSLKVDGVSVTDNTDGDKGQYVGGKVSGNFGRITDTEWHTIEFKATVKAGQAGKMIENIGEVTADNVARPEKPSDAIVVSDNEDDNNPNPGGTGDSDGDSNEDPNGNSNEDSDKDSNGDSNGDSNTGAQTPDDHNDSTLGESDAAPQDPAQSGDQAANEPNGNKLPNTATNMYSYMLAGSFLLLAGLLLLRRKKA